MEFLPNGGAGILVALISMLSSLATQKASSRASRIEKRESGRLAMENEAYIRARNFDIETIKRQAQMLSELRIDIDTCRDETRELRSQLKACEEALKNPEGG